MALEPTNPHLGGIVARPGAAVKARIVAAGIPMKDLAREAGIHKSTLSDYISGRLASPETQTDIWICFRRLAVSEIGFEEFWGRLFKRRAS